MKIIKAFTAATILAAFFVSCNTMKETSNNTGWEYNAPKSGGFQTQNAFTKTTVLKDEPRVVVYNATMDLTVKIPDSTNARLSAIAEKHKGYVQKLGTTYSVIRVKSENLDAALREISLLGKVTYKTVSGDDVTEDFKDLKIRLENAEKIRSRYIELLAKAQNVNETISVERELERLNIEIDQLKGKIGSIAHLSEFSTIHLNIKEKTKPGIVGYVFVGIYKGVKWLFVRN
ncbi:MAG: DUF4349 domain-containing protein [Bacteroidia bacterium]|nr:DUF4349 domain-containing protein [Bacteroidia bacterium]